MRRNKDGPDGMLRVMIETKKQKWPHTIDAGKWAKEFMKRHRKGVEIDEGLMIGWFANAITAGYDTAMMRVANERACLAKNQVKARITEKHEGPRRRKDGD